MRSCSLVGLGALVAVASSCAAREPGPVREPPAARPAARGYSAAYLLSWSGQRIGHAAESLHRRGGGYELVREEHVAIRRGDRPVSILTTVRILLDADLTAEEVAITRRADDTVVQGRAHRGSGGGWVAEFGDQPAKQIDGDAVPFELIPLLLARQPRFQGTVMLPGYGFATGELYAHPGARPRRVLTSLVFRAGVLTNELQLGSNGLLDRVIAPGGVESVRVDEDAVAAPFDPPEVVDAASIPVAGRATSGEITRLILDRVAAPNPPALPGQLVRRRGEQWEITLASGFSSAEVDRALAGAPAVPPAPELEAMAHAIIRESGARAPIEELRALAQYTDRLIENDLAATPDARTAFALGRGDCTAHATVFAAFAAARGFDVRLVTGYRLADDASGHRLVRHRWAVARVDDRWIAIDPTSGEAPAAPVLLGLTTHGASAAEMAIVDELAFSGFDGATARFR